MNRYRWLNDYVKPITEYPVVYIHYDTDIMPAIGQVWRNRYNNEIVVVTRIYPTDVEFRWNRWNDRAMADHELWPANQFEQEFEPPNPYVPGTNVGGM